MNKRPIIIDTGSDIDDILAIATALPSDELDIRLISTTADNVGPGKVTHNALRLLKYFRYEDIPMTMNAGRPLIRKFEDASSVHGKGGAESFDFEEPTRQLLKENVADVMCSVITNSSGPVTLAPIAPLTNIALLLKTYPEMKRNIHEIVPMGGSASRGNKGIMAKFNIVLDPKAAHMVFHSGVKLTMVRLDIGLKALILPEDSGEIRTTNKTGEMAYCLFKKYHEEGFRTGLKIYDATVVIYLLKPELSETIEAYLDIELYGMMTAGCTLIDLKGHLGRKPNVIVYLDIDESVFRTWFKETIAKCRQSV